MQNRRQKKNIPIRKSCDYLIGEMTYVQNQIDFLKANGGSEIRIAELQEDQYNLRHICDELKCPEDTSPEGLRANKKLLEEIKEELGN